MDAITFIAGIGIHLLAQFESFLHRVTGEDRLGIRVFFSLLRNLDHNELFFWAGAGLLLLRLGVGITRDVLQCCGFPRKAIDASFNLTLPHAKPQLLS